MSLTLSKAAAARRRSDAASTRLDTAEAEAMARTLRQFRRAFNTVTTHFQQVERAAGVGAAQVWALAVVCDHPGIGVTGLAQAMDVRQPTASNLVRALVQQGHLVVRREGADRRAVQLHLQPAGAMVLRGAPGPFVGLLPQALAALSPATLQRLEQDLALLIQALDADQQAAAVPLRQMSAGCAWLWVGGIKR